MPSLRAAVPAAVPAALAGVLAGVLATTAVAAPSTAVGGDRAVTARASSASLAVLAVPAGAYVAGQSLTWQGNIGATGVRRISLQLHISRPGDEWMAVDGFSGQTDADGGFSFRFPAPAMNNIRYRVVSGSLATPPVEFDARAQDLTLALVGGDTGGLYGRTEPGKTFALAVDTTPKLARRPDTLGLPAFPGRTVTLQRRAADGTWTTVDSSTTDAQGDARFPGLKVATAGVVVYRVKQEDYTVDGHRIGWFPSFPYYVYAGQNPPARSGGRDFAADGGKAGAASQTASQRYGWGRINYDFGWIRGESLTSPPQRGTQRAAYWQDRSDGAGRATTRNGGLELVSSRVNDSGPGDFGSTYVTAEKAAQTYGRWELRMRSKVIERGQADYRMVAQLVPDGAAPDDCSQVITVAEVDANGTRLSIGATNGTRAWRSTRAIASLDTSSPAFAVEVTPRRVTWFMDGAVIGTVRSAAATSDRPMTMRIGLVGAGDTERNHTSLFSDWVRSFPLGTGRQAGRGPALARTSPTAC
jgi:hypothetical protein